MKLANRFFIMKLQTFIQFSESEKEALNKLADADEYLPHVPHLKFVPADHKTWHAIQDEGVHHEQNAPHRSHWEMAHLPIKPEDAEGLRSFHNPAIDKFNRFDIALKHRHGGKLVDLVDYDKGHVKIVRKRE
jgi:hypothetical protein